MAICGGTVIVPMVRLGMAGRARYIRAGISPVGSGNGTNSAAIFA